MRREGRWTDGPEARERGKESQQIRVSREQCEYFLFWFCLTEDGRKSCGRPATSHLMHYLYLHRTTRQMVTDLWGGLSSFTKCLFRKNIDN